MRTDLRFVTIIDESQTEIIELRRVHYDRQQRPYAHESVFLFCKTRKEILDLVLQVEEAARRPVLHDDYDFFASYELPQ